MQLITTFKDGTILYRNPISGTECWYTPNRKHRPGQTDALPAKPIVLHDPQDYCSFCPAHYRHTTPEKERLVQHNGQWHYEKKLSAEQVFSVPAEMRRIANLFEIIPFEYWRENYGYTLTPECRELKENYLSTPLGREHILELLHHRLHRRQIVGDSMQLSAADAFFGGSHDLIIPKLHFRKNALTDADLFSTGEMTVEEHRRFFAFTQSTTWDIYRQNPFVRFVAVFTNWRRDAGATFSHLHRQAAGIDYWGKPIRHCLELHKKNPRALQEHLQRLEKLSLIICENEHAVAAADFGRPFSTVIIINKSNELPYDCRNAAFDDMADVVHAVHAAFGAQEACNEEWFYPPPQAPVRFPWFVLVIWRKNRHAGFEGITGRYTDVFRPEEIRDRLIERLLALRRMGKLAPLRIGRES